MNIMNLLMLKGRTKLDALLVRKSGLKQAINGVCG